MYAYFGFQIPGFNPEFVQLPIVLLGLIAVFEALRLL
jgi:hypothetical protein